MSPGLGWPQCRRPLPNPSGRTPQPTGVSRQRIGP
ncbi:hypothetical protein chiPu_0029389, partial [Chiloscyllium punctatum]|nr:hypothetical protein [Chiloscyllium punctatum]